MLVMHIPLDEQEFSSHKEVGCSHVSPSKPAVHWHEKVAPLLEHVPPFMHGFGSQRPGQYIKRQNELYYIIHLSILEKCIMLWPA